MGYHWAPFAKEGNLLAHFLDDFLRQPNFKIALRDLARDFRSEHGFPIDCDEIGVVCADVEVAAAYLQDTYPGMGPFFLGEGGPKIFSQGGRERPYRTRVGFGYYQDVLIELAEPGEGSEIFDTHLDRENGKITVHHMGFFARGDDLKIRVGDERRAFRQILAAAGYDAPQWEAQVAIAGVVSRVTIYETYDRADNLALEFLDFRLLGERGIKTKMPRGPMELLARAQIALGPRVLTLPGPGEGLKKTWHLTWTRQLKGTPAQVWPLVIVPEQMNRWADADLSMVQPGEGGRPDRPGMIRRAVVEVMGIQTTIFEQIDETEAPHFIAYHAFKGGFVTHQLAEITLKPHEGGTLFTWKVQFQPEVWGTGSFVRSLVDTGTERSLDRLQTLCLETWGSVLSPGDYIPHGSRWDENRDGKIAVFRGFAGSDHAYLKLKGALAWEIFLQMTACEIGPNGKKRRGEHLLGSIANVIDGPVIELRIDNETGALASYPPEHFGLLHSATPNRHYGQAEWASGAIRLRGGAGQALAEHLGRNGSVVELQIVDLARGEVVFGP